MVATEPLSLFPDSGDLKAESGASAMHAPEPTSMAEVGLSEQVLIDLTLKMIRHLAKPSAYDLGERMAIPTAVLTEILEVMKEDGLVEIGGAVGGRHVEYSFVLTDRGKRHAAEAFDRNGYLGPAPLPFSQYLNVLQQQSVREARVTPDGVRAALADLVLSDDLLESVGAALTSGRSMMLYGPSGNGKSSITTGIRDMFSGSVLVPHAIEVEGQVIRIYDERVHRRLDVTDHEEPGAGSPILRAARQDARLVRCERPIVMVSGELTLESLELQFASAGHFYNAPPQMQANGGVLVIDDLGRQSVRPEDLLNRWITPMQSGWDQLRLQTGGSVSVPFDLMLAFSTNLQPHELGDEAFFRRIRHKVVVPNPTRDEFIRILKRTCESSGVTFRQDGLDLLLDVYTDGVRELRGCHPGDIVANLVDLARFRAITPELTTEQVQAAIASYFVAGDSDHRAALKALEARETPGSHPRDEDENARPARENGATSNGSTSTGTPGVVPDPALFVTPDVAPDIEDLSDAGS